MNIIPEKINQKELLIRGIVKPLFFKKKLTYNSLLPPNRGNRNDVSVLRYEYTNLNFCKSHTKGLKLGEATYCGLAALKPEDIYEINSLYKKELEDSEILVSCNVKSSPLDQNGNELRHPVYDETPGLPMHADLIYNINRNQEVETCLREYAKKLIDKVQFIPDNHPEEDNWVEEDFKK